MNNRRREQRPKILRWLGDLSAVQDFLDSKSWVSPWALAKFSNSFFRSIGVVAFAGNLFTGVLIFVAMVLQNPTVAMGALLTGSISIVINKLIKAPDRDVCSGVAIFNSILVGCVVASVVPDLLNVSSSVEFWLFLAVAGCITPFIDQGLQVVMGPSRLPVQSVPFNLVAAVSFLMLRARYGPLETPSYETTLNDTSEVDWSLVMEGSVRGVGQIYGVGSMKSSLIIWIGFLLYSPLLAMLFYAGSVIGACTAVFLNVNPLVDVYSGLWSYNSLLASGGIAYFVAPTPMGIVFALVNAFVAVCFQAAVSPIFMQTSVPVFSFPFNAAIMLILALSLKKNSSAPFIQNRTFPEEHLMKYYSICGSEAYDDDEEDTVEPLRMEMKL